MKHFQKLAVTFSLVLGGAATPTLAQWEVPFEASQTVTIIGRRLSDCYFEMTDSGAQVLFNCPTYPVGGKEFFYRFILPAIMASPDATIAEKCNALANALKIPCIKAGESASSYSTRAVSECASSVEKGLPTGTPGAAAAAFSACNAKRAEYIEAAEMRLAGYDSEAKPC